MTALHFVLAKLCVSFTLVSAPAFITTLLMHMPHSTHNHYDCLCTVLGDWHMHMLHSSWPQPLLMVTNSPHGHKLSSWSQPLNTHTMNVSAQCWVCGEDWSLHGSATGGYYRCNRNTPQPQGDALQRILSPLCS
jgi:hypothetical protein